MSTDLVGQVALIPGSDNLMQWLICRVTGSECAHMILCTGPNECVSADGPLVDRRPLTDWPTAIWSKFQMSGPQQATIAAFGRAQVGKKYAYLDDALIAFERVFRFRFPRWLRDRFATDGKYQCAELCDSALKAGGIQAFDDNRSLGDVFPGSFEELFITRGWYTKEFFQSFKQWR